MSHPPDSPPSRPGPIRSAVAALRRPRRFSLRGLLATVVLLALALAWPITRANIQRDAVRAIRQTGGQAYYDWQFTPSLGLRPAAGMQFPPWLDDYLPPWAAEQLVARLGPDHFGHVVQIQLGQQAGPAEMEHVARLRRLRRFQSASPRIGKAQVVHLAGLTDLDTIELNGNAPDIAGPMADLSRLTRLTSFRISDPTLADADLAALRNLPSLQILRISHPAITDAGLVHLADLPRLSQLAIDEAAITAAGLARLRGLRGLRFLRLDTTRVADLAPIAPLSGIQQLSLDDNPITDAGLAPIARLAGLSNLTLQGSAVTDAGLVALRELRSLADLDLGRNRITDAGLAVLGRCPELRHLRLADTRITDAGLDHLVGFDLLYYLDVSDTEVTPERAARFGQAHPSLTIRPVPTTPPRTPSASPP